MRYFLAKTDPQTYSLTSLQQDGVTVWDGVTNPQAVRAIRHMRPNDKVLIYHSGGESAIVGWAQVKSAPRDDPNTPRSALVDLAFAGRIDPPVSLKEIKASDLFSHWALLRQPRLSTMEAPPDFVAWLKRQRKIQGL